MMKGLPFRHRLGWDSQRETAVQVLRALPRGLNGGVFPGITTEAIEHRYVRAGIANLWYHDLRHEATTRLFNSPLMRRINDPGSCTAPGYRR
jgi:hypothetical protein